MPTLDDVLHRSPVIAFLDFDEITALQSLCRGFNSERSDRTTDDSFFINFQQYKPRALAKCLLGWMRRDFTGDLTEHSNEDNRLRWEFGDWEERFDMDSSNEARDRELKLKFCQVFGCTPALCFQLCLSLLQNDCQLPKPEHILWTCLHITAWSNVASSIDRSATFVGVEDTASFEVEVSRVSALVSRVFDGTSTRSPLPPSYSAVFSPHCVNKSAFYMTNDELGYEYEFVAAFHSLNPFRVGYIHDVALRYNPHYLVQPHSERQIGFYQERLENEVSRVGEKVMITSCHMALYSHLTDTVLSLGSIVRPPFRRLHPLGNEHRLLTVIHLEENRVGKMQSFIFNSQILFKPCSQCTVPHRCTSCEDGEAQRLNILKFTAHLINIGMTHAIHVRHDEL